ncbi:MAG: hypothetical protein ABIU87_07615 [Ornithinibacter sp.]
MASGWTTVAAVVLISTGPGGCAGSDVAGTPGAVREAASAAPSDLGAATAGDANLDGQADTGAALSADELCGFLAEETPKVIDLKPAEYAAATFGGALFTFYTGQGLLTDIDGAGIDALAAEGCPDAAAALLPVLGASSFEELLSR